MIGPAIGVSPANSTLNTNPPPSLQTKGPPLSPLFYAKEKTGTFQGENYVNVKAYNKQL